MVHISGPTGHRLIVQRTEVTQEDFERMIGHNPSYHRSCSELSCGASDDEDGISLCR